MKFQQSAETAVVIPVHGGLPLTVRCLDSLRGCDPLPVMVVVVDDGSPDDTAAHLATHYPDVQVVAGDGSLWWSGAINAGCDYAIGRGARTLRAVGTRPRSSIQRMRRRRKWMRSA